MLGLSLSQSIGNILGSPRGGYTRAYVEAFAGVSAGVTPGVTAIADPANPGVFEVDYGPTNIAAMVDPGGGLVPTINVTSRSVIATLNIGGKTATLTTVAGRDTYTFQDVQFYLPAAGGAHFIWNDSDTSSGNTYDIVFKNMLFGIANTGVHMMETIATGNGGRLRVERSFFQGGNLQSADKALVKNSSTSLVTIDRCAVSWLRGYTFWKANTGSLVCTQTKWTITDSGFWNGGFSNSKALFYNTANGGSITAQSLTMDYNANNPFMEMNKDCLLNSSKLDWNPNNQTGFQYFLPTNDGTITEPWISGWTLTDSRLRLNNVAIAQIGWQTIDQSQALKNILIEHCELLRTGATSGFGIALGNGGSGAPGATENIRLRWNRFSRPSTPVTSGVELIYLGRPRNAIIEANWTDGCGEDAYEIHQPMGNCHIRYNGGTGIGGNIADMYGAFTTPAPNAGWGVASGNTGGNSMHDLWGECGSDAVSVDCIHGVTVYGIDAINATGAFVANPPAASVRLHSRSTSGIASLDGVIVRGPLSSVANSYGGYPCLLTQEHNSAKGSTVNGTAVAGVTAIPVPGTGLTNFADGDFIRIAIVTPTGGGHYAKVLSRTAGNLNIDIQLPYDTVNNGVIQAIGATESNAGSVSWYNGIGLPLKTSADVVCDGM